MSCAVDKPVDNAVYKLLKDEVDATADEHYMMRVHAGWRVSVTLRVLYRGPSTCPSENSGARLNCGWI